VATEGGDSQALHAVPPADQEVRNNLGCIGEGERNMYSTIVPSHHTERLALPDMRWKEAHLKRVGSGDDLPSQYLFLFPLLSDRHV
jgi:hypothetical protein